jgi:hypothetical protein
MAMTMVDTQIRRMVLSHRSRSTSQARDKSSAATVAFPTLLPVIKSGCYPRLSHEKKL